MDVFFKDETVWLTQKALAALFGVNVPAINKHLKNIFDSGELTREATVSKMEIARAEGGREVAREVEFYNLDAIIAVGYRVNIVSAYLDLAENRAERGILMKMADWVKFLHSFLELSNYPILQDKGKVSALEAKLKAEGEYEVYRQRQDADYISDFDREIKRIEGKKP